MTETQFYWFIVGTVLLFVAWKIVSVAIDVFIVLEREKRNKETKARWGCLWGKSGEQAKMQSERENERK